MLALTMLACLVDPSALPVNIRVPRVIEVFSVGISAAMLIFVGIDLIHASKVQRMLRRLKHVRTGERVSVLHAEMHVGSLHLHRLDASSWASKNKVAQPKPAIYWLFAVLAVLGSLALSGLLYVNWAFVAADPDRDLWLALYGVLTLAGVGLELLQTCQEQGRAPESIGWWELLPPLILSLVVYYTMLGTLGSDPSHFRGCVMALLSGYAWRRLLSSILKSNS